ncbi:MAG: tetratricopeptide repeat protein [Anaerolineales bacterium]|nr:tetratricopeptide repeat protein [Anaerolineales bacterium]MCS7246828.1 tetratricopeptide repeat protein [Anaerolineales bacterium]MDW8160638.1 tetratricopeptide repeat protein [Anaerolineales bacterium]MDW8446113.1 tetratricopeptide repeat protein [Anaerolineales bacterium]
MGDERRGDARVLFNSAWAAHARGEDSEAEKLFRQSLELEPNAAETLYGLAMVLKATGRVSEAIQLFEEVVYKVDNQGWTNRNRAKMLRRLALGQINYLRDRDWNLEKEIWQR